jgi:hypothetical protein
MVSLQRPAFAQRHVSRFIERIESRRATFAGRVDAFTS